MRVVYNTQFSLPFFPFNLIYVFFDIVAIIRLRNCFNRLNLVGNDSKELVITSEGIGALKRNELSKSQSKVLWWLVDYLLPGENVVIVTDVQVACGIPQQATMARIVKKLIEDGFIEAVEKVGRSYCLKLNETWFVPATKAE